MRNSFYKYMILAALAWGFFSCKDFSLGSFIKGDAIASVGGAELYFEDVKSIFTPGMDPEDSLELLNSYIDIWIKHQLKVQMAEENLQEEEKDVAKLVADYRNSLLIYKFEQKFISENMDTVLKESDIADYYNANIDEFKIAVPLMKAIVVKVPVGFRQESAIRGLARSGKTENFQDMIDICIKNNLKYDEFTEWVDFSVVSAVLPRLSAKDYQSIKTDVYFYEVTDEGYRFFIAITSRLPEGTPQPLDKVRQSIKVSLLNKRKQEVIKLMEESIYNNALRNNEITINK